MIGVWPNLDELVKRRDETADLIERRIAYLRRPGSQHVGHVDADPRVQNLRIRFDSYERDILAMQQHAWLGAFRNSAGLRWKCACGAIALEAASTPLRAARAHGAHVQREVWGG